MSNIVLMSELDENSLEKEVKNMGVYDMTTDKKYANKVIRTMIQLSKIPKIQQCTKESVKSCIFFTVASGLEPALTEEVYYIPRSRKIGNRWVKELQWQVGYKGIAKMLSWDNFYIEADVIHENDTKKKIVKGTNPEIIHEPALTDRGKMIGAYSVIYNPERTIIKIKYMDINELSKIREMTDSKKDGEIVGPWRERPGEMSIKAVIKNNAKALPLSPRARLVTNVDNATPDEYKAFVDTMRTSLPEKENEDKEVEILDEKETKEYNEKKDKIKVDQSLFDDPDF